MQTLTRTAARSACRTRLQTQLRQRRWASQESHHGSHEHVAASPNESFGPGFFVGLLCIPAAVGLYTISQPGKNGEQAYFSHVITQVYADYAKKNEERNTLHTDAIEQAAADRALFLNPSTTNAKHIDLRFYDQFNNGAPHNVPAGHGHANIDAVIEKYQREAYEANEKKLQQLRDNNVPCEQPLKTTMPKVTPGVADS